MFQALVWIMLQDGAGGNGCLSGSQGAVSLSCVPPLCRGLEAGAPSGSGVWSSLAWVFQCQHLLSEGRVQLTKAQGAQMAVVQQGRPWRSCCR